MPAYLLGKGVARLGEAQSDRYVAFGTGLGAFDEAAVDYVLARFGVDYAFENLFDRFVSHIALS